MNINKNVLTPQRLSLIEFARTVKPTHLVTFNFHAVYQREQAELKLGRWYTIVNRRLFRKLRPEPERQIEFVAFPEKDSSGHTHYHALMRVPASEVDELTSYGRSRWKCIVPTSTFHIRPIESGEANLENALLYVTKSTSAHDVVHSGIFHR